MYCVSVGVPMELYGICNAHACPCKHAKWTKVIYVITVNYNIFCTVFFNKHKAGTQLQLVNMYLLQTKHIQQTCGSASSSFTSYSWQTVDTPDDALLVLATLVFLSSETAANFKLEYLFITTQFIAIASFTQTLKLVDVFLCLFLKFS